MKRFSIVVLFAVLVAFVACGQSATVDSKDATGTTVKVETKVKK
jgi:hypothetical protein